MHKALRYSILLLPLVAGALLIGLPGCEDEPDALSGVDEMFSENPLQSEDRPTGEIPLDLVPLSASVSEVNDLVTFQALGGVPPFSWSVGDRTRGYAKQSRLNSDTALYVASVVAPNTILVFDSAGRSGVADIAAGAPGFQILPTSVTIDFPQTGQTIQFRVVGGTPPYGAWSASIPALGTIDQSGIYTVASSVNQGVNTVSILDSAGAVATAQVTHQIEQATLRILPSAASLDENGDTAWFAATGGTAPYGWSIVYPGRGTITSVSADTTTMTYQRTSQGDQTVLLSDAAGNAATVDVTQQDPTPPTIDPATSTLTTNQLSIVLSAAGGEAPYVWFMQDGPGSVDPRTGPQTVYTRGAGDVGVAVVGVTDSNGRNGFASINLE